MFSVRCQELKYICIYFFSFFFFLDKEVELVGGGSVINGAYPVHFYTLLPFFPSVIIVQKHIRVEVNPQVPYYKASQLMTVTFARTAVALVLVKCHSNFTYH